MEVPGGRFQRRVRRGFALVRGAARPDRHPAGATTSTARPMSPRVPTARWAWARPIRAGWTPAARSPAEFLQFLGIAGGSPAETETYLVLARRPEMAEEERIAPVLARARQVGMMLNGLERSLREKQ